MADPEDAYRDAGWWTGERLVDRFESHVRSGPETTALVSAGREFSRARLWEQAGRWADVLANHIEGTRQLVVIHLPNNESWMVAFLATMRAGHVPATTPITTTTEHLHHIVNLTAPAAVITCPAHRGRTPLADVGDAVARADTTPGVLSADAEHLIAVTPPGSRVASQPVGEATDHIMFTSSTTGPPKAVSHRDDSLGTLNRQFADRFGLDDSTALFMPSPLGHSVGAIHGARLALYLGAPLILQD